VVDWPRQRLLTLLAVLVLASSAVGCAAAAAPAPMAPPVVRIRADETAASPGFSDLPVLRVAFTDWYAGNLVLWIAESTGLFARHRIDATVSQRPETAALAAIAANELDVVVGAGLPTLVAVAAGADVKIVAGLVQLHPFRLMAASSIQTAGDLRGMRLGVNRHHSGLEAATRYVLAEFQLEAGTDVLLVQIGSSSERLAALENGAIHAAVLAPPDTSLLERQGFTTLRELDVPSVDDASSQVAVAGRLVRERSDVVQRFVDALIEATAMAKREPDLAKRVLGHYVPVDDESALDDTYELFVRKGTSREPYPAAGAIRRTLRTLTAADPALRPVDPTRVIDSSFVQQAVDAGLVDRVYGRY
jgi:NitT/TauT family transport system substrate-binding protein